MAHMQPDIRTGAYWEIECSDGGTYFVPTEVTGPISVQEQLRDYVEADIDEVRLAETEDAQVLGRLSAPGYLDCTDWNLYDSSAEALEQMGLAVIYQIPAWALSALVNCDTSGINEQDQQQLQAFQERETDVDWNLLEVVSEPYFTRKNDVNHLGDDVVDVLVMLKDEAIA